MEDIAGRYLKTLLGLALGVLFIWLGVTGRLGSLLGAIITPGYMAEGTPDGVPGVHGASGDFGTSTSGGKLTDVQIAQAAKTAGILSPNLLTVATAIAIAESQGNPQAHNPGNGTTDIEDSYGLWQINVLAHPSYDKKRLYDPGYNATAMFNISSAGTNWNPWGTYTSGEYRQYISRGQTAANQVQPSVITAIH